MTKRNLTLTDEFVKALASNADAFRVSLGDDASERLRRYYELLLEWNARLHLVAPCSPEEFAVRHVLESMLALPFLGSGARMFDVGSGAGLPAVPCLIVRPDLSATLVEASPKKSVFLREALRLTEKPERATVVAARFEKLDAPDADVVTCRALDRFKEMFARLVAWSHRAPTLLLFGGHSIREQIERAALPYTSVRVPRSEQRFLFVVANEPK
jgi:16S rRNA (guanine(527)-N(7))-methyltransferase RsmG